MGRKKLPIRRIEDRSSRQVTFSKRRSGLMKKARELSVLCDVDIGVLVFSGSGKLYHYSSDNSLNKIVDRYHKHIDTVSDSLDAANEIEVPEGRFADWKSFTELLETVKIQLEAPNEEELSVEDLTQLETQLDVALRQIKAKKGELMIDSINNLQQKEITLREEIGLLEKQIEEMKNNKEGEMDAQSIQLTLSLHH